MTAWHLDNWILVRLLFGFLSFSKIDIWILVWSTDDARPILTTCAVFVQADGSSNSWVLRSSLNCLDAGFTIPLWPHTSSLPFSNISTSLSKIISIYVRTRPLLSIVPRIIFHKLFLVFLCFPTLFLGRIRPHFQLTCKNGGNVLLALVVVTILNLGAVFKPTTWRHL